MEQRVLAYSACIFVLVYFLCWGWTNGTQIQMRKDAVEYLDTYAKASQSGMLGESGLGALFNVALSPELRTKKIAIQQKYQGDDYVKFMSVLKSVIEERMGKSIGGIEMSLIWLD